MLFQCPMRSLSPSNDSMAPGGSPNLTGERKGRVESEAWRVRDSLRPNDRSWLQGDIQRPEVDFRSTSESRHSHGHH